MAIESFSYEPYAQHLIPKHKQDAEEDEKISTKYEDVIAALPRVQEKWFDVYKYQGFWHPDWLVKAIMSTQEHFHFLDTDILLASYPKSGTTWLKALIFATVHRGKYTSVDKRHEHPLLHYNPHDLVLQLENLYGRNQLLEFDVDFPQPRLIATHIPYTSLPESVEKSSCRIVYICRNSKDTVVSLCQFLSHVYAGNSQSSSTVTAVTVDEHFKSILKGFIERGDHWDHILSHWRESVFNPEKVLFLRYEKLHEEPIVQLTKLATFLGFPFSEEEEKNGIPEEILQLCSFQNLTNLEVNNKGTIVMHRKGATSLQIQNSSFFGKGKANDFENHLTEEMIKQLDTITQEKLQGSGLTI